MSQWFRIFGRNEVQPAPAELLETLHRLGVEATANFCGDDLGWFQADFLIGAGAPPLRLERYLTKEDAIRGELNTWAAWLESAGDSPAHLQLMQHVISARQLFTLHEPLEHADEPNADARIEALCLGMCQFLARLTEGVYQADHHGFFDPAGTLLVVE
jgi:hypothetical protein